MLTVKSLWCHRYKISNRAGVHVYQAVEDTGFCWRCCCTQLRPVHMKVYDQTGSQVTPAPAPPGRHNP